MIPMLIAAAVAAAVSAIGMAIEAGERERAQKIREEVAKKFGNAGLAQLDDALVSEIPSSELAGIVEDKKLREAQLRAMDEYEKEYEAGGMGESDVAALRLAQQDAAALATRNNANVQAGMARRGIGNSGLAAMASLQSGQNAANAMGRAGVEMQSSARLRALQALDGMTGAARGIRGDDWRASSAKASAQDQLNQYNNEHKFKVKQYNNSLSQQRADNDWRQVVGRSNAELGLATSIEDGGKRASEQAGQIAQGVNQAGASVQKYLDDEEKRKTGGK